MLDLVFPYQRTGNFLVPEKFSAVVGMYMSPDAGWVMLMPFHVSDEITLN